MAIILDGKAVSAAVKQEVRAEVETLRENGLQVGLAVIIVGDNPRRAPMSTIKRKPVPKRAFFPRNTPSPQARQWTNCSR